MSPNSVSLYEVRNKEGKADFAAKTGDTPYGEDEFDWDSYQNYRPQWPQAMFDKLFTYHADKGSGFKVACDFGSGIGIIVPNLLQKFEHVHVLEPSKSNALKGTQFLNSYIDAGKVTWHAEMAHSTPMSYVPDGTVDMFTAAIAAHYFDFPAWLAQAARKLKSGGTLATLRYSGRGFSATQPELDGPLADFYTAGESATRTAVWAGRLISDWHSVTRRALNRMAQSEYMAHLAASNLFSGLNWDWYHPDFHQHTPVTFKLPDVAQQAQRSLNQPLIAVLQKHWPDKCVLDTNLFQLLNQQQPLTPKIESWTTDDLIVSLKTYAVWEDWMHTDPDVVKALGDIHRIVGGKEGTFKLIFEGSITMVTRK